MKVRFIFLTFLIIGFILNLDYVFALTKTENNFEFSIPSVFIYDSEGIRDPFLPLVVEAEKIEVIVEQIEPEVEEAEPEEIPKPILEESEYVLLGLIWDEEKVLALIQTDTGKWIVQEGIIVNEFLVSEINKEKEEVVLTGEKEIIKLRIRK